MSDHLLSGNPHHRQGARRGVPVIEPPAAEAEPVVEAEAAPKALPHPADLVHLERVRAQRPDGTGWSPTAWRRARRRKGGK